MKFQNKNPQFMLVLMFGMALGQYSLLGQTIDKAAVILQVDSLIQVSRNLTEKRDFDNALIANTKAEKLALEALGRETAAYGNCCHNHGRVLDIKGIDIPEALSWYLEAKAIREKVLGKDHPDYATSLNNLANLYKDLGDNEKAEILYLEAKAIREKALGKEHPDYAWSLNNLANLFKDTRRYEKAELLYLEAIAIREKVLGKQHPDYASSLNNLAVLYRIMGYKDKAEQLYLETIAIREKVLGKQHPDYASSLNNLSNLYMDIGDYEKAESLQLEAIAIREKVLGREHPDYASSLNNLANMFKDMRKYEKVEALHLQAIAIRGKVLGKEHPDYAVSLNNLAVFYRIIGDYEKSETRYLEAIAIRGKVLGREHPDYAVSLNNLAVFYRNMGNYEKAEPLNLEAIAIRGKVLGKEHRDYAASLNNLAVLYGDMGFHEKAEPLYIETLAIKEKMLGKKHISYVESLSNLAKVYFEMGDYQKAEQILLEIEATFGKTLGKEHPNYALNMSNLADLYYELGNYEKAEPLYLGAKTILGKALGKEHPNYAMNVNNLANLYAAWGNYEKAIPLYEKNSLFNESLVIKALNHLSEQELNNYLHTFSKDYDLIFSFAKIYANKNARISCTCYDNTLFYKGFLLNAANQVKRLTLSDPATTEKFNLLKSYTRLIASEYAKPIDERKNVAELEEKANAIEKELTRKAAGYGEARRQVRWQEMQQKLKAGEAAVEFVHYRYFDKKETDSTMYAAMLLRPGDKQPLFITLFEEKDLTALFQQTGSPEATIREVYQTAPNRFRRGEKASRLYDLIWKPLEKELRGVKKIYYSPSGLLHQVAFDAIAHKPGQLLADRYDLEYVSSTRELVTRREALPGNADNLHSAAIFGGIRYETDSTAIALEQHKLEGEEELVGAAHKGDRTKPVFLPGSLAEMRGISAMLRAKGIACDTFSNYAGSEGQVKELASSNGHLSPDILHLSTHGYYLPDPKNTSDLAAYDAPFKWADNPLFRSWLLMAGGMDAHLGRQTHTGSHDDGVLTAYEIAPMNLSNTKLVVLSACQTGLGDLRGSEGVYGLQRAFKMAGVERLLVTLWQVDDRATAAFMAAFYAHWLSGMDIRAAFRKAQADVRATKGWEDPYFWAGFVLM